MNLKHKLTEHESKKIEQDLNQGVAHRGANLVFVFSLLFSVYGVMSAGIISKYSAEVSLWSNSWPRILFNGLPFLLLGLFLKRSRINTYKKILLWAVLQPLIFMVACCIYVWPIMMDGHLEIYKYFHAANMFVITFGITFVAPSRKVMWVHVCSYSIFFLVPLMLIARADSDLSSMIVNDYICMTLGAVIAGQFTYELRKKVAFMDAQIKSTLTPFVGNTVASAIYNQSLDNLNNKSCYGLILSMDIRGYTKFLHTHSQELSSSFMKDYHFLVSTTVGKYNGFIHKTVGDSHIISFGLMDESADLSDIEDLKSELVSAEKIKSQQLAVSAQQMFDELIEKVDQLKASYHIIDDIWIGAGIAAGNIQLQIQGNQTYRQEVNIDGDTIVRCARLEAYTKLIMNKINEKCSVLIFSPEMKGILSSQFNLEPWSTDGQDMAVRDYPDIKMVYYKKYQAFQKYRQLRSA